MAIAFRQPSTQENYDYYKKVYDGSRSYTGGSMASGIGYIPEGKMAQEGRLAQNKGASAKMSELKKQLDSEKAAAWKIDPSNPEVKSQAAWDTAMGLLQKPGPYTPEVVNQLTNRRADQTAAAEAVNAEDIRNQAAARGMDPTQAIRGLQQDRQRGNIAFSGDIASRAAVDNFAAEAPGRMMAAQANLNRQFGGATQNAVAGGGGVRTAMGQPTAARQTAFSGGTPTPAPAPKPVIAPTPQRQPMSVADRNAAQTAWANSGGKTINGTTPGGVGPTAAANAPIYRTPAQQASLQNSLNSPSTAVYRPLGVPSGFGGPTPAAKINTAFNPFK
jgi:hypothetical protein